MIDHKTSKPIRILIADDHAIFRDALRTLLEMEPEFAVVGEASDGDETLEATLRLRPDILLLDLNMPRIDGLQTLKDLTSSGTQVRIILLTAEIERSQIMEALIWGASGFLMKDSSTQLLFKAIHVVMSGQYWIGRDGVKDLINTLRDFASYIRNEQRKDNFGLTAREMEIIGALSAGDTNKDIARRFSISEQTVKHHLTSIYNKVGVSQRLELALFALNNNLLDVDPQKSQEPVLSHSARGSTKSSLLKWKDGFRQKFDFNL
jgi:DNA-binding NarL/FixJ family response regulator